MAFCVQLLKKADSVIVENDPRKEQKHGLILEEGRYFKKIKMIIIRVHRNYLVKK